MRLNCWSRLPTFWHQSYLQNFSSHLHLSVLQDLPIALSHLCLHCCLSFYSEAATRGIQLKNAFLEISWNSQENTWARVLFLIKLLTLGPQFYWKRDSGADVFLWILWNFLEQPFVRTPVVAASIYIQPLTWIIGITSKNSTALLTINILKVIHLRPRIAKIAGGAELFLVQKSYWNLYQAQE